MEPTLGGFIGFITNVMGISATYLPSDSPIISYVFNFATELREPSLAGDSECQHGDVVALRDGGLQLGRRSPR